MKRDGNRVPSANRIWRVSVGCASFTSIEGVEDADGVAVVGAEEVVVFALDVALEAVSRVGLPSL